MLKIRTDLALEAREIWSESADKQTQLEGVIAKDTAVDGFTVTTVKIVNENGEKELCKPIGTYITIDLSPLETRAEGIFERGAAVIAGELRRLAGMSRRGDAFVVGLGNASITPDAIGPKTARHTLATRHLTASEPASFGALRSVAVMETGVLGTTGVESAEIIRSITGALSPECVIAVDALASRSLSRVCNTVQLSDTGIVPGSGVGNRREALNEATLGVKVIALGVPTVVDAATVAADMAEKVGLHATIDDFSKAGTNMIVTPRDIDSKVTELSRMVGVGINLALHENLSLSEISLMMG